MTAAAEPTKPSAKPNDAADIAWRWWSRVCHPDHGDRAARAKLRRCADWRDAALEPAAHALLRDLRDLAIAPNDHWRAQASLELAMVLAHVQANDGRKLMQAAGYKSAPRQNTPPADLPLLSPTRFKRILKSDKDEIARALIRLVQQLGGSANIRDVTVSLLEWNDLLRGDGRRRKWAFDYYAARTANPDSDSPQGDFQ